MDNIAYLLPALGCAAMMGVMMWMMRGRDRSNPPPPDAHDEQHRELSELRAEVDDLRADEAAGEAEAQTGHEQDR